jgi:hypothetical protein
MAGRIDLTGWWFADRNKALYFLRHLDDNTIFWAGMRSWWGFRPGLEFTNVFHGSFDPATSTIAGAWTDIPLGVGPLRNGRVRVSVTKAEQLRQAIPTPERPLRVGVGDPTGTNGDGPPPSSDFILTVIPEGTTGPFPNQTFAKNPIIYDVSVEADFISFVFDRIKRGIANPLTGEVQPFSDELQPAKDNVVLFGHIAADKFTGIGFDQSKARDYCVLVLGQGGDRDGDITFNVALDTNERRDLDTQQDFWVQSSGWLPPRVVAPFPGYKGADDILKRLNLTSAFHAEIVMFGREENRDHCNDSKPSGLVPGWAEFNENSIAINGLPINCNIFEQGGQPMQVGLSSPEIDRMDIFLVDGLKVRIAGVITIDTGHSEFDLNDHPTRQLEIHPVYAIDVLQDFTKPRPFANLTGVWDSHDGGTYYVRQIDAITVVWLGMSSDHGYSFTNVFSGRIEGNLVRGDWADLPVARGGTRNSGQLTVMMDRDGPLATSLVVVERTGGFGASVLRKLYDRPFTTGAAGNTAFPGHSSA